VNDFLARIVERTRADLASALRAAPLTEARARAEKSLPTRAFEGALREGRGARIIAEIKRASPSRGPILPDLDPSSLARAYAAGGAAAISVLTNGPFFSGSLADLAIARRAIELPVLRKDFTLDAYQLYEARAGGADAVLLIAAVLEDPLLRDLHALAGELGLAALVEVHDERELERALAAGARVVGINARDLRTFRVDLGVVERLCPRVPPPALAVAESGIAGPDDVRRLHHAGARAFLVGESLAAAPDPRAAVAALAAAVE
jgi:indole-3-glycerol phosphate synthase